MHAGAVVAGGDRTHHLVIPSAHQEAVATVARGLVAERPTERGVAAGEREAKATVLRRAVAFDPVPEPAEREAVTAVARRLAARDREAGPRNVETVGVVV